MPEALGLGLKGRFYSDLSAVSGLPSSLEAARLDGAGPLTVFTRICLSQASHFSCNLVFLCVALERFLPPHYVRER